MNDTSKWTYLMFLSGGVTVLILGMIFEWRRRKIVKNWKLAGYLSKIYIYPLKSGRENPAKRALTTSLGLKALPDNDTGNGYLLDRSLVIFENETHMFLNSKKNPKLIHIRVEAVDEKSVEFTFSGSKPFKFQLPKSEKGQVKTNIEMYNKEKIATVDCGDEVGEWLTEVLQSNVKLRLGYWVEDFKERRDFSKTIYSKLYKKLRVQDTGAYSDMSSYLLMNQLSLDDLRSRISTNGEEEKFSVTEMNFRPNILIIGTRAYEEDNWDWIKIGDKAIFRNFKPCTRCSITTMDPQTGIRHPGLEPLKTLKKYRQLEDSAHREVEGSSPVMGIYIGLHEEGIIEIGDPVYVA